MIDDVADLSRRKQYTATEGQTEFPYPFKIYADTDLLVYRDETLQTLNSGYTVTGVGNDTGGNVVLLTSAQAGTVITIAGNAAVERTADYQQNGPWTSDRLNDEMDKVIVLAQEQRMQLRRAVRGSVREAEIAELPAIADRASKFLFFDEYGNPVGLDADPAQPAVKQDLVSYPAGGDTVVSLGANYTPGAGQLTIALNGVVQVPGVDYVESSTSAVTFTAPLNDGDVVHAMIGTVYNGAVQASYKTVQTITATDGQTVLTTSRSYVPGNDEIEVVLNGLWLTGDSIDYTETDPNTITMTSALIGGDQIKIIYGQTFDVASGGGGGSTTYALTAAETAAGVSPLDVAFEPGDPRRYGAAGDGVTDDSNAVLRAFQVARYSGFVRFRSNNLGGETIYRCASIDVPSNVEVTSDEGVVIEKSGGAAGSAIFQAVATLGAAKAITGSVTTASASMTVADTSGLVEGEPVIIRDATYAYSSVGRNQEINEISTIAGTTVVLKHRPLGTYSSTPEIVPFTTAKRGIVFRGIRTRIPTGVLGGNILFQYAYDCHTIDTRNSGSKDLGGLHFAGCGHCSDRGSQVVDGQSITTTDSGRGIVFTEASNHCFAKGSKTRNVRENVASQRSRVCGFADCEAVAPRMFGFGTNGTGSLDCYVTNCTVQGSYNYGVQSCGVTGQAADKYTQIIGNRIYDSGLAAIRCPSVSGKSTDGFQIAHNIIRNFACRAAAYGIELSYALRPVVAYNHLDGNANATGSIYLGVSCADPQVTYNGCRSNSAGYGIVHEDCLAGVIANNDIRYCDAAKAGIYAAGTGSLDTYVENNTVDNDVRFTNVLGPVYRNNRYALKKDVNRGVATIGDGGTITHGLIAAPTSVIVSGSVTGEFLSVTTKGATTFTVAIKTHANGAGTSQAVSWEARV